VHPNRSAEPLTARVQKSFKRRAARGDKYPLFWSLHEVFFFEFYFGAGAVVLAVILQCVGPFALRFLIQFAADAWAANERGDPAPPFAEGIGLAIGITTILILQSLGISHFTYNGMMVGGQSRGVLIGLIYEKAMVISSRARAGDHAEADKAQEEANNDQKDKKGKKIKNDDLVRDGLGWGNGRIINLMSVDTYRIDQANGSFHLVWAAPLAVLITLALLIVNLTYSALAGFALIVIAMPLLGRAVQSLLARRSHINRITDQRVSLTQEILQAVRFVKFFGWEKAFMDRLEEVRRKEIRAIQYLLALRNLINAVSMAMPLFASMVAFICFSLTQNTMPPAEIFSSLALFNTLRIPLNLLPLVIGQVADAWGSMARVQEFLLEEDQEETAVMDDKIAHAVDVRDASFTWERTRTQDFETDDEKGLKSKTQTDAKKPKSIEEGSTLLKEREPFKLHDLSFQVGRNELVAVIGSVGSGKSSLLAALAGDMRRMTGQVTFGASKSFCPQYAWIQNATLQENIILGGDIDKEWYRDVVHAYVLPLYPYLSRLISLTLKDVLFKPI
jgi:ATP-binding cassette subfamily C (CFTR/MRP) protein 1